MPTLMANNGPEAGKKYELSDGEYLLGRHPECHVVIDVGAVSRHHCKVFVEGSSSFILDLESRNGTFVNESQIAGRTRLNQGDQVRVCDVVFTYQSEDRPSQGDDSSISAVLVDDDSDASSSTIMSKLDVVSSRGRAQLAATAEAKLNALIEITQSLGKAISLDEVLPKLLDGLFRIFHQADRGFIGLVDETGTLVPRWTKLRRESGDETIRVSRRIAQQVMQTKEAILSADATADSRFEMSQSIAELRIRSMMCAPLVDSSGNVMGILQIDTIDRRQGGFQDEDLELLVSVAYQAAIAIVNAQLHEDTLKQRTLERDLQLAHDVQHAFLPDAAPDMPGYDFFQFYEPANQIGGDYYDYVSLPDKRLAVIVADVVGHGIAAAMLMAKLAAEVRFCLASQPHPATAVTNLNQRMCRLNLNRFVTFVMVTLDGHTHEATIVNAGHPPPLYRKADGSLEEPGKDAAGLPLGIVDNMAYQQTSITLAPGESLTMLTDGIPEAMNAASDQFSVDRVRALIDDSDGSPRTIVNSILQQVRVHMKKHPQDDDMCLVSLRRQ